MNGHPSSLQLERFSVDDLPADAQERTRAHVLGCGECTRSLGELDRAREDCLRQLPPAKLLGRIAQKRSNIRPRRLWIGLSAFTAAAAAFAVILFFPRSDRVQLKGASVSVYCRRGEQVRLLAPGERIRASDGLPKCNLLCFRLRGKLLRLFLLLRCKPLDKLIAGSLVGETKVLTRQKPKLLLSYLFKFYASVFGCARFNTQRGSKRRGVSWSRSAHT